MAVSELQTIEQIYGILRRAVMGKRPISAIYNGLPRRLCPHRLGQNKDGELRVLCYQYGGESERGLRWIGSPDNWRCVAVDGLTEVKLLSEKWRTASNHLNPQTCVAIVDVDADDPAFRK